MNARARVCMYICFSDSITNVCVHAMDGQGNYTMSEDEVQGWEKVFNDCPIAGEFGEANCPYGPHFCKRNPTVVEVMGICDEVLNNDACRRHQLINDWIGTACKDADGTCR